MKIISFLAIIVMFTSGCATTKITTKDFEGNVIQSSKFTKADVVFATQDIQRIKRELNNFSKVKIYGTQSRFENLCSINNKFPTLYGGRQAYTAQYFRTNGNPVTCSAELAKQVSKNSEQANYVHAYWMNSIKVSISLGQQRNKRVNGADQIPNELQSYIPYMNEIKLAASQYKRLKELNRKKNNPNSWLYRVSYNEFDQKKTYYSQLKNQKTRNYDNISLALECRKTKDFPGKLSLSWESETVITVPNKKVTLRAVIGNQPLAFDGKMYSNSYKSGFVSDRNNNLDFDSLGTLPTRSKNFKLLLEHLIARKPLKYRIETLNRDKFVEGFLPIADNVDGLLKVIDICSDRTPL